VASRDLADLETRLGHAFADRTLLERALAHRSWCAEHGDAHSNERLEFLGDAVLGWVVADTVYRRFGDSAEGRLSDLRKAVVNARALAAMARRFGLGDFVLLGRGEDAAGGRQKESILSDALEAVIGAVYLDGGAEAATALIRRLVDEVLERASGKVDHLDHKSRLQELLARRSLDAPRYEVSGEGPDHHRWFCATVSVGGAVIGRGEGPSKKRAEQAAAAEAHRSLEPTGDDGHARTT